MVQNFSDNLKKTFEALDDVASKKEFRKIARSENAKERLVECIRFLMRMHPIKKCLPDQIEVFKISCVKEGISALGKLGVPLKAQSCLLNDVIHHAVDHRHTKLVRWCLRNGASVSESGVGSACLEKAIANCDEPMVKLLISKGADVNSGKIPCWLWAAPPGRSAMLPLVFKAGANINARSHDGDYTALHIWVACSPPEKGVALEDPTLDYLIAYGIDLEAKNQFGKTAKEMAMDNRRPDLSDKINAAIARHEKERISKCTVKTTISPNLQRL